MSAYGSCWLGNLLVGSSRNEIDPGLMSLFRASDRRVISAPLGQLPHQLEGYRASVEEDANLALLYYETDVSTVCDRLELMGYDLETAKQAFRLWIKTEQNSVAESIDRWAEREAGDMRETILLGYDSDARVLSELTPEMWVTALRQIHDAGIKNHFYGEQKRTHSNPIIQYMLQHDWFGFPGYDTFVPLRLAIEVAGAGRGKMLYDLTDLVWDGYVEMDEDVLGIGLAAAADGYSSNAKTVVLTEGKTDAWIVRESLRALYPHLDDLFAVFDFDGTAYGGGVGNLVNVIKAFAGAGIVNNIVALFDNDTASAAALRVFESIALPPNIAIVKLPEIPLLEDYPTIGPSGSINLNVNGIAASIELYLGEDVLNVDGVLSRNSADACGRLPAWLPCRRCSHFC